MLGAAAIRLLPDAVPLDEIERVDIDRHIQTLG
jgi:hypothetical protein